MNEEMIFQQINLVRKITLNEMKYLSEDQVDQMPKGFRNTIRWNLGHIYTFQNLLFSKFGGKNIQTSSRYLELFSPGTKPADWDGKIPALSELKQHLEEQPEKMKESLSGQLDDKIAKKFLSQSTIGGLLIFSIYHEGMHLGAIKDLKKLTV
ncbi:DinB family protein [Pseudogracilibacillus sp. SE30717A]|uniref:DinB family protein n=1 Tax=Pseudogracilibacillus sp. SE30717A TaxID=3098293 RepID=UPI00300DEC37